MRWPQLILLHLLLAIWVPSASYCLLESAGWVVPMDGGVAECHGSADQDAGCTGPCGVLAAGGLHVDQAYRVVAPVGVEIECVEEALDRSSCKRLVLLSEVGGPDPPALVAGWRFVFRVAGAPRAPSLLV